MVAEAFRPDQFARMLDQWNIQVVLIFLLIFVILYAILQKTRVLGEGKKNLNIMVAVIVGLLVIIPHVTGRFPPNADPVVIIGDALPSISIVLVAIIFLLIMIGVFGQEKIFLGMSMPGWVALFSFAVIVIVFGGSAGWWTGYFGNTLEQLFGTESIAVIIMLLVFGMVIAWITSDSKEADDKSAMKRMGVDFSKLFGGGGH